MTAFTTKGVEYGWTLGENGWGDPMNLNLQILSAMGFGPFSVHPETSGLDVDVIGGLWWNASTEVWDTIADDTLTLTDAATNYVEVTPAGVISANTTGFTYGSRPIAVIVTAAGAVTSITDRRTYGGDEPIAPGRLMGRDRSGTVSLKTGLDASGADTAAVLFVRDAPRSTGNATPAALVDRVGALVGSGSALQTLVEFWRQRGNAASATIGELVLGLATTRIIPGATALVDRESTNTNDARTMNAAGTTFTHPLATAWVLGTDPGGSGLLRVGGSATINGNTLMGTTTAATGAPRLDVVYGGVQLVLSDGTTDTANKILRVGVRHYTNAEETVATIIAASQASASFINIGGGSSLMNAMTSINFYTAANNTTVTGTLRGSITSAGLFDWVYAMTVGGLLKTAASTTTSAGIRIPHGAAPTAPVDGDMWTTTAGLFVRINGATVGPLT